MATVIPRLENVRVLVSDIHVDPALNSRKNIDEDAVKKLAGSVKEQGMLHPPIIMRSSQAPDYTDEKEPYLLIAGFRRQAAMTLLEQTEGDYRLAPAEWGIKEALAANLVENLNREDLTPFEVANQCLRLEQDHEMSASEISKALKSFDSEPTGRSAMSVGHINNMIRCARDLHPAILKAWQEQHPKASLKTLIKLVAETDPSTQHDEWKGIVDPKKPEKDAGTGNGTGTGKPPAISRPTGTMCAIMVDRVKESKKDDTWKEGAISALKWAAGASPTIPGVDSGVASPDERAKYSKPKGEGRKRGAKAGKKARRAAKKAAEAN